MPENAKFDIEGMMCDNCVGHVSKALLGLPGVVSAHVSLDNKEAIVEFDPEQVTKPAMAAAVEEEGYVAKVR